MELKILKNDQNLNVLLVVHDPKGRLHKAIEAIELLIKDLVTDPPICRDCGGEGSVTTTIPSKEYKAQESICPTCKGSTYLNLVDRYNLSHSTIVPPPTY